MERGRRGEEWLKEQHPEALEGAATDQVSISHVSLPVGLSGRSVAWHGGQRGTGPVRLTQEVMHRANGQTQAHMHPQTHTHTHHFYRCKQVWFGLNAERGRHRSGSECMHVAWWTQSCKKVEMWDSSRTLPSHAAVCRPWRINMTFSF